MNNTEEDLLSRKTYEGRGDTWQEAFDDAATKAIRDGVEPGTELDVLSRKVAIQRGRPCIVVIG